MYEGRGCSSTLLMFEVGLVWGGEAACLREINSSVEALAGKMADCVIERREPIST